MTEFTPVSALIGGALIGLAASLLLVIQGRIAGISGIARAALFQPGQRGWRVAFLIGMLAAATLLRLSGVTDFEFRQGFPILQTVAAGLLVGFGTALGSGCTSGHGVCGTARLSPRSIVATVVFLGVGMLTVGLLRHWLA